MTIEIEILQYLHYNPLTKRSDILPSLSKQVSDRTLMRMIADGVAKGHIEVVGRGPATRYRLTPQAHVTMELNLDTYFDKDVDERQVLESFNFELINEILPKVDLFTDAVHRTICRSKDCGASVTKPLFGCYPRPIYFQKSTSQTPHGSASLWVQN